MRIGATANWFDNLIGFFSPRAKSIRLRDRAVGRIFERKYEGAARGRRTDDWFAPGNNANAEISRGQKLLAARSHDLVRNNPYSCRGINVVVNNSVGGRGIIADVKVTENRGRKQSKATPRPKPSSRELELKATWSTWANTSAIDFEGRNNMAAIQRAVMRGVVESGEVLIRRRRTSRRSVIGPDGITREVPPIELQVLESDHLDTTRQAQLKANGNTVIQGIEFDTQGKRVAYHIFETHPGANDVFPTSKFNTVRVLASDIIHVFQADRPGQVRGVPWLAPVMLRIRDLDKFEDAQLVRQQVAACFTAFIKDSQGQDNPTDQDEIELSEKMEPGAFEFLPPGKDIELANPPDAGNYKEYLNTVLHAIASGLGITFEALTGDLSEVNFSSARMGHLEFQRNIDTWRWQLVVPQFLNPVFDWFLEGIDLIGLSSQNVHAIWTAPRREMVDPTREVPAIRDGIRSGLMTLSEAIRQSGQEPERFLNEYAADNKRVDDLQLILDSDARKDPQRLPLSTGEKTT